MSVFADRPIESRNEDDLGRWPIAEALAAQVASAHAEDGLVMGVSGPWGSGKTSLLNMLRETVVQGENTPVIVRFNPWLFSSSDELVVRFFSELSAQLDDSSSKRMHAVAKNLATYGSAITPMLSLIGGPAGALLGTATHAASEIGQAHRASVFEQRKKLKTSLRRLSRRIVVFIDDIDRLTDDEVRDVVRLVKLVGDLPHVVYVLAYQRERVESALGRNHDRDDGRAYLAKIVQVTHDLPPASRRVLGQALIKGVREFVGQSPNSRFDESRWRSLYASIVSGYVATVRDVHTLLNALPVTLSLVGSDLAIEDVVVLEALRVFEYGAWELLPRVSSSLTRPEVMPEKGDDEKRRRELQAFIEVSQHHKDEVRALIRLLFPVGDVALTGEVKQSGYDHVYEKIPEWRAAGRVAHSRALTTYLARVLPEGAVPTATLDEVITTLNEGKPIDEIVGGLSSGQLEDLLVRLHDRNREFNPTWAVHGCVALFGLASRFGPMIGPPSWGGVDSQLTRLAGAWLEKIEDAAKLRATMVELFSCLETFSAKFHVIQDFGSDLRSRSEDTERPTDESEEVPLIDEELTREFHDRLSQEVLAADPQRLAGERRLAEILKVLLAAPTGHQRLRELAVDDGFLLALLRSQILPFKPGSNDLALPWRRLCKWLGDGDAESLAVRVSDLGENSTVRDADEWGKRAVELAARYAGGEPLHDVSLDSE